MRGRVAIRDALAGERRALEELQLRASLVWEDTRADLLAHPEAVELPAAAIAERRVRVAVGAKGAPDGFSVLEPVRGRACELDGLFVEPARMRRGIGRALVADAADRARAGGARRLDVVANPRAAGFYRRVGFRGDAPVPTRFGAGLRMSLTLTGG